MPSLLSRQDAERKVIGASIMDDKARASMVTRLLPSDFENEWYRLAYIAIQELMSAGKEVDLFTIHNYLIESGRPSDVIVHVSETVDEIPNPDLIEEYCNTVLDAATRRRIDKIGGDICRMAAESTSLESEAENAAGVLVQTVTRCKESDTAVIGSAAEEDVNRRGPTMRLQTPWPALNADVGGFEADNLILIGARPGVGKTAAALQMAVSAAEEGHGVLYVSAEMSRQQLWRRMVYQKLGISPVKQSSMIMTKDERDAIVEYAIHVQDSELPLYIMDGGDMSFASIYGRAKAMDMSGDLGLVVVDYLQILDTERSENRALEIARLSKNLKRMSRQLSVPVIALSQLNRSMEGEGRTPQLSDLRESGALEQDADIVLLLHRKIEGLSSDVNKATMFLAKHRQGPTARYNVLYSPDNGKFFNMTRI